MDISEGDDDETMDDGTETLAGETFLRHNGGPVMAHEVSVYLTPESVECDVYGFPATMTPPLRSSLPEVRTFVAALIVRFAMSAHAKQPAPKPSAPKPPSGWEPCPVCLGTGSAINGAECDRCDGRGLIPDGGEDA